MSRRDQETAESLDLLLDTLCNTFAALLFIAILLVVLNLSEMAQARKDPTGIEDARADLIERQIADVRSELERLSLQEEKTRPADNDSISDLARIESEFIELSEKQRLIEQAINKRTSTAISVALTDTTLSARELDSLVDRVVSTQRSIKSKEDELAALKVSYSQLRDKIASTTKPTRSSYRLPKEQERNSAQGVFVIVRENRIYPIILPGIGEWSQNQTSLQWQELPDGFHYPEPIAHRGWTVNRTNSAEWEAFVRRLRNDRRYCDFQVFPDSFEEFARIKQYMASNGMTLAFEVVMPPGPKFGSAGRPPGPTL